MTFTRALLVALATIPFPSTSDADYLGSIYAKDSMISFMAAFSGANKDTAECTSQIMRSAMGKNVFDLLNEIMYAGFSNPGGMNEFNPAPILLKYPFTVARIMAGGQEEMDRLQRKFESMEDEIERCGDIDNNYEINPVYDTWLGVSYNQNASEFKEKFGNLPPYRSGSPITPNNFGVEIIEVIKDSPASKSSISQGEIIIRFNGMEVNQDNLSDLIRSAAPGEYIDLTTLSYNGKSLLFYRFPLEERLISVDFNIPVTCTNGETTFASHAITNRIKSTSELRSDLESIDLEDGCKIPELTITSMEDMFEISLEYNVDFPTMLREAIKYGDRNK